MISGKGTVSFIESVSYDKKTGEHVEGIKVHCILPFEVDGIMYHKVCVCWVSKSNPIFEQIRFQTPVMIRFGKYGEYIFSLLE